MDLQVPGEMAAPAHVVIDARVLNTEHLRGMGKCLWHLVSQTPSASFRLTLLADRPDLPFHSPPTDALQVEQFELRGYRFRSWEQLALPARARRVHGDLLHCPAGSLPWWQPVPTVVTLHDAMPWMLDEPGWPAGFYRDSLTPAALRRSAAIITVSDSSRRDIISLWPKLAEKIHVIPNGVGEEYLAVNAGCDPAIPRRYGLQNPYVLYFGGSIPRKRLDWALKVFELLPDDVTLGVCGIEQGAQPSFAAMVSEKAKRRLMFLPFVPEADLPSLYRHAGAVIYPTSYEGFGLPALEAQAVGTPVVFSSVNGLAELIGPGALVVPLEDARAWRDAITSAVDKRRNNDVPDEAARTWARQFSWQCYVARTLAVWQQVLTKRAPQIG